MADIASVAIAMDIGRPLEFSGIGVSRADVAGLQCFEVLEGAEFVCL